MAKKNLKDLALERGFIDEDATQEVEEDTQKENEEQELTPDQIKEIYDSVSAETAERINNIATEMCKMTDEQMEEFVKSAQSKPMRKRLQAHLSEMANNEELKTKIKSAAAVTAAKLADLQATLNVIGAFLEENRDLVEAAGETVEELRPLVPFIQAAAEDDPKYKDIPLKEIIKKGFDEKGSPTGGEWEQLLNRAKEIEAEYNAETESETSEKAPLNEIIEAASVLPMLRALAPDKHIMPKDALMNALQEGIKNSGGSAPTPIINNNAFDLILSNKTKSRKEITAYTMIQYVAPESSAITTPFSLTEYERQVSDAIMSLFNEAETQNLPCIFTPDMVYRAMPGGGEKASPAQKGAITKTINKLRALVIYIDITEYARIKKIIGDNGTLIYNDNYLHIEGVQAINGKQEVSAFHLIKKPVMLEYAHTTKQILTIPSKYIEIRKIKNGKISAELVAMTIDRQSITGYLLRQISWIKHDINNRVSHPRSDTILFDTIFKDVGIETNKQTNKRQRDFIFDVLDYEKAAGYISDYEILTKGKSYHGVKIIP